MKKVLITTLGCKVNQYESAAFKAGFESHGLSIVSRNEPADIVVVNTCAVTAGAGSQSRQAIRQGLRQNPSARIIITGCYAELGAAELEKEESLQGRSYSIIGNAKKDDLVTAALSARGTSGDLILGTISEAKDICRLPLRRFGDRARAYLRIQDGCESFCSYCIVPYTRGPSRSLPVSEVIEQAKIFTDEGHHEIVLTGIHLGNYGKDLRGEGNFVSLLDKLSSSTPDVSYRISSLEPLEISEQLLTLMQERSNIHPHLHIPLQSGHDDILTRMNRRYTTEQFRKVIELCTEKLPDAAIGIDILAGFPGESEQHFKEAITFLHSINFTYLHVFPYSKRPGTRAAEFSDQIPKTVKEERVAELRKLSDSRKKLFYTGQLNQVRPVVLEGKRNKEGLLKGFTDNYVAVCLEGEDSLLDKVVRVRLIRLNNDTVIGEHAEKHES